MTAPQFTLTVSRANFDNGWDLAVEWDDTSGKRRRRTSWTPAVTRWGARRDARRFASRVYRQEFVGLRPGVDQFAWTPRKPA